MSKWPDLVRFFLKTTWLGVLLSLGYHSTKVFVALLCLQYHLYLRIYLALLMFLLSLNNTCVFKILSHYLLKIHKHAIFFAETETLWSQVSVTRDFWKSYPIRPRHSTFKHFRVCLASDGICSPYAQPAMKFVPRRLSKDLHVKTVHILPLAEHERKFVPRMLSVRWNSFCVCSPCACYNFRKLLKNLKLKCRNNY